MSSNLTFVQIPEGMAATPANFNSRFEDILENFDGAVIIGDTANANATLGLTINQGANDDQILAFKSSDVDTGLTTLPNTDTEIDDFGTFAKKSATGGGLRIQSLAENAADTNPFRLESYGGQPDTTKSTAGRALVEIYACQHDGANTIANIDADGGVFGVRCRRGAADVTLELIDEDGDKWIGGSLTTVGALLPNANDGAAIGVSGTAWADLFLASGAVINFNAGDITITHSATNEVTISGGLIILNDEVRINGALDHNGANVGFYGATPTAQQTGVAVSAAGIHAALVNLGLITA